MSEIIATPDTLTSAAPEAKPGATGYVILALVEGEERWRQHGSGTVPATSAEGAIRMAIDKPGTYVAIPLRSWRPTVVRTETTTRIIVETT